MSGTIRMGGMRRNTLAVYVASVGAGNSFVAGVAAALNKSQIEHDKGAKNAPKGPQPFRKYKTTKKL